MGAFGRHDGRAGAGNVEAMPTSDHSTEPAPALPKELRGLTYEQATPEQVARTREYVRAQLAAADASATPEERERRRADFLDRLNAA
jgi:hypothetical protein